MRAGSVALGLLLAASMVAETASARVMLTASRKEMLLSGGTSPDCTNLHTTADGALPYNAVRLHAAVEAAPTGHVRYRWSAPNPLLGVLAADMEIGTTGEQPAIRSLCAELGNACVLTPDKLPLYDQPTILWLAPTCDVVPDRTTTEFHGGQVRIAVAASVGKRKLGRSAVTLGFGRQASVTLYADGKSGLGSPGGIPSGIGPAFSVRVDRRTDALPKTESFDFDNGDGATASVQPRRCTLGQPFDACAPLLLYRTAGRSVATVTQRFDDGSVLCDKTTVDVLTATIVPKLQVSARPGRRTYRPGENVGLRVRLHNASPQAGGAGIVLLGNVLSCSTEVKVGKTTLSQTTSIDLQHCSTTVGNGCTSDADCDPSRCGNCQSDEVCLTASHCSAHITQGCTTDADCSPSRCPSCRHDESCVKVLPLSALFIGVGDSVDLVDTDVSVLNVLADTATVTDVWTVHTVNAGDASDVLKYRIRGRPGFTGIGAGERGSSPSQ